ncbi:uncharacterized protein SPAPADRAFT_55653 [Spathaspora passalidarum NRRL Y-27907]|uniref:Ataxin-10 homolog n=1 Tax=Spathaspora passalidarum (strain NRRL Y-27907 / 11-Y1) TaxID=619300 RepID=G3APE9_SPAPN|nr:uncharacterized protein SPAPADRAFT_55653 [Spathaspora passalidarum NRRL Y-27907]EGW32127.1 hypothetical protein SPAPADRAFT_55653 [Spathaspora passalidarum NRRL Y-27907]
MNSIIKDSLIDLKSNNFINLSIDAIRLYRGLLLIIRNIAPRLTNNDIYTSVITSFVRFSKVEPVEDWNVKTELVYWQILANFPRNELVAEVNQLFEQVQFKNVFKSPIVHYLFRQLFTEDNELTNFKLQEVLKLDENYILRCVYSLYLTIDFTELDHDSKMFIHLLYDVITHESFVTWIAHAGHTDLTSWLELTSTVVQTRDQWNIYELTALISWNIEVFLTYSKTLTPDTILQDFELEEVITVNLHILSELGKFEIFKKLLAQYPTFLEQLISVFGSIHNAIKPVTIKNSKIEGVTYNSVKSSIIIILSYLTHESFEVQEQVRELGGLALILSNCVIDNNNPFIKEHAIVCLKYLLQDNKHNQQVVADLEAKRTVDDKVLQEVGYQVEVVEGKVQVKKKQDA